MYVVLAVVVVLTLQSTNFKNMDGLRNDILRFVQKIPPLQFNIAPEIGWLEDDRFLLEWPIFRGKTLVSRQRCEMPGSILLKMQPSRCGHRRDGILGAWWFQRCVHVHSFSPPTWGDDPI